jgi:hypothetical protein
VREEITSWATRTRANWLSRSACNLVSLMAKTESSSPADFPTTPGAFQAGPEAETFGSAFVTKLNSAGSALVYSTYLADKLFAHDIGVDSVGNAYVTGARSDSLGNHRFVTKLQDDQSSLAPLYRRLEQRKHHFQTHSVQPGSKTVR